MDSSNSAIELFTHRGPREFMDHAGSFLLAHEAENNLLIGIAAGVAAGRDVTGGVALGPPPQFTVVEDEGRVVMTAVRTPPHSLVVSRGPLCVADSAAVQLASMDKYPGVRGHASTVRPVVEGIAAVSGQSVRSATQQRIYEARSVRETGAVQGRFRAATSADVELLARWMDAFMRELLPEDPADESERVMSAHVSSNAAYVWDDGKIVSLAIRGPATPGGQRIQGVYTPPEQRSRGYATACVGALSRLILAEGYAFVCLHADRTNARTLSIYERLGYRPVADFDDFWLDDPT